MNESKEVTPATREGGLGSGMLLRSAFLCLSVFTHPVLTELSLCSRPHAWCGHSRDNGTTLPSKSPPSARRDGPKGCGSCMRFSFPLVHFFPTDNPASSYGEGLSLDSHSRVVETMLAQKTQATEGNQY